MVVGNRPSPRDTARLPGTEAPAATQGMEQSPSLQGPRGSGGKPANALSERFQRLLEDFFERVGALCARHAYASFLASLAVCFACAMGASKATMDGNPYSMFTVYRGQWELGNAYTLAHQGGEEGVQPTFEYIMLEPHLHTHTPHQHRTGDVLTRGVLDDQLRLLQAVDNLTVAGPAGRTYRLADVCQSVDIAGAVPDVEPALFANLTGPGGLLEQALAPGAEGSTLQDQLKALAEDGTLERVADVGLAASPLNVSSVRELHDAVQEANLTALGQPNMTQAQAQELNQRLVALMRRLGITPEPPKRRGSRRPMAGWDPETGGYVVRVRDEDMKEAIGVNGSELNQLLLQIKGPPTEASGGAPTVQMPRVTAEEARAMRESTVGAALAGDPYATAATVHALAALYDLADRSAAQQARRAGVAPPEPNARPEGLPARFDPEIAERFVFRNGSMNPAFVRHVMQRLRLEAPPGDLGFEPVARQSAWRDTHTPAWHLRRPDGSPWLPSGTNASNETLRTYEQARLEFERTRGAAIDPSLDGANATAPGRWWASEARTRHRGLDDWLDAMAHALHAPFAARENGATGAGAWAPDNELGAPADAAMNATNPLVPSAGGGGRADDAAAPSAGADDAAAPSAGADDAAAPSAGADDAAAPSAGADDAAAPSAGADDARPVAGSGGPRGGNAPGFADSGLGRFIGDVVARPAVDPSDIVTAAAWEAWLSVLDRYNLTSPQARAEHEATVAHHRARFGFKDAEPWPGGGRPSESNVDHATAVAVAGVGTPPSEFATLFDLLVADSLMEINRTRAALGLQLPLLSDTLRRTPMPSGGGDGSFGREDAPARPLSDAERFERLGGLSQLLGALFLAQEAEALGIGDTDIVQELAPPAVRHALRQPNVTVADAMAANGTSRGDAPASGVPLTPARVLHAYLKARRRYESEEATSESESPLVSASERDEMNAEVDRVADVVREQLHHALRAPCIRTTVLDCFTEGGYDFGVSPDEWRMLRLLPAARKALDDVGIDAYTQRPSFRDPVLDLKEQVTGGCPGFAAGVPALWWHEEAILGGLTHDPISGKITGASALRATVLLAGDRTIARRLGMDEKEAHELATNFRIKLEELVPSVPLHASSASVFVSDAFLRVVDEHMGSASQAVGAGYLLMVLYVLAVLRTPKLALSAIALLICDLAGGFGLACVAGVPSSILTLTVLPFVALGIAVDGLFLILRTFQHEASVVNDGDVVDARVLVPRVTRAVGPSILFTGCTNGAAYAAASTIPLHAIMNFSRQCGILLFFNAVVTLVGVPALIAIIFRKASPNGSNSAANDPASVRNGSTGDHGKPDAEHDAASNGHHEQSAPNSPGHASRAHAFHSQWDAGVAATDGDSKDEHGDREHPAPSLISRMKAFCAQQASTHESGCMVWTSHRLARGVSHPWGHWGLICAFGVFTAVALVGVLNMEAGLILSVSERAPFQESGGVSE